MYSIETGYMANVSGGILTEYIKQGGGVGWMGYPRSEMMWTGSNWQQNFQYGTITIDSNGNTHASANRYQKAIAWAHAQIGKSWSNELNHSWSGWCEAFVEIAYGTRYQFGSAYSDYLNAKASGRLHTGDMPPYGALVYYGGGGGYGHVGVSVG